MAKRYQKVHDFLFLGRGIHYPIALEGALKLKEISYIHAEGYPAGEMKHGPNALIDENLPVVVIATRDVNNPGSVLRYEKTMSNLKEVKARSGVVIALATEGDEEIKEAADHVIYVPRGAGRVVADSGNRPAAIAGLSHRGAARLRRGSAAESGQVSYGGVARSSSIPCVQALTIVTHLGRILLRVSSLPFSHCRSQGRVMPSSKKLDIPADN